MKGLAVVFLWAFVITCVVAANLKFNGKSPGVALIHIAYSLTCVKFCKMVVTVMQFKIMVMM